MKESLRNPVPNEIRPFLDTFAQILAQGIGFVGACKKPKRLVRKNAQALMRRTLIEDSRLVESP